MFLTTIPVFTYASNHILGNNLVYKFGFNTRSVDGIGAKY